MRRLFIIVLLLVSAANAATKLRLHNYPSGVAGYKALTLALGPSGNAIVTSVTQETSAGNDIQWTSTAGGSVLKWISEPLSSTTTISGTITFNFYARETATNNNSTIRPTLILYHGGAETTTITNCGFATELTASIAVKNWTTASGGWTACSVTSTSISVGDRIVLKAFINGCTTTCTVAGSGMGTGTVTVDYDGATDAADGSSWVQLNETETFSPESGPAATPDLANNWIGGGQTGGGFSVTAGGKYNLRFPHGTQSGNALVVACYTHGDPGTRTVTDDQSNAWTAGPLRVGAQLRLYSFVATNIAANTRVVSFSPSSAVDGVMCAGFEFTNVATAAALDGSSGNSGTNASITAGSFTTNYNGDLVVQFGVREGVWGSDANATSFTVGSSPWVFLEADLDNAQFAAQFQVQPTAAAINATYTQNNSAGFNSVALALRAATSGSTPTGMHIIGMQHMDTAGWSPSPGAITVQVPTRGNLIITEYLGNSSSSFSGCTSSPSNTWTTRSTLSGGGHLGYILAAENASPSTNMTLTCTIPSSAATESLNIYDVSGAATSPYDTNVTDSGSYAGCTSLSPASITPSTSNGLIFAMMGEGGNSAGGISTSPLFDSITFDGEIGNDVPTDRNNGFAHYANPNTSAVTFTWTFLDTIGCEPISGWGYLSAAFKAPTAASGDTGESSTILW